MLNWLFRLLDIVRQALNIIYLGTIILTLQIDEYLYVQNVFFYILVQTLERNLSRFYWYIMYICIYLCNVFPASGRSWNSSKASCKHVINWGIRSIHHDSYCEIALSLQCGQMMRVIATLFQISIVILTNSIAFEK